MEFKNVYSSTVMVTLCGSSSLKEFFLKVKKYLSLKGYLVFDLPIYSKPDNIKLSDKDLEVLIGVHQRKIRISDKIIILTKEDLTIGENTYMEYQYAKLLEKDVYFISSDSSSMEIEEIQTIIDLGESKYLIIPNN